MAPALAEAIGAAVGAAELDVSEVDDLAHAASVSVSAAATRPSL